MSEFRFGGERRAPPADELPDDQWLAQLYGRANVAVVLCCAVAAAVLTGALVVGDSVRGSLRDLTLERLGASSSDTVVIEDSRNGLEAAHALGLTTVITVNGYTEHEDFSEAALVLDHLGEPTEPLKVAPARASRTAAYEAEAKAAAGLVEAEKPKREPAKKAAKSQAKAAAEAPVEAPAAQAPVATGEAQESGDAGTDAQG